MSNLHRGTSRKPVYVPLGLGYFLLMAATAQAGSARRFPRPRVPHLMRNEMRMLVTGQSEKILLGEDAMTNDEGSMSGNDTVFIRLRKKGPILCLKLLASDF